MSAEPDRCPCGCTPNCVCDLGYAEAEPDENDLDGIDDDECIICGEDLEDCLCDGEEDTDDEYDDYDYYDDYRL